MRGVSTRGGRRAEVAGVDTPTISLRLLREGDRATLRALRDALHTAPGWFSLDAEDAIPSALVRECYARARAFFSLPTELKRAYVHTQYARETGGYVPLLEEYAYRPNEIAILESFDTVRDVDASKIAPDQTGIGPVDWPLECPGMKTALRAFYEAADNVARDLLTALARARFVTNGDLATKSETANAAALSRRLVESFTENSACSMRVMRYPGTRDKRVRERVGGRLVGFEESLGSGDGFARGAKQNKREAKRADGVRDVDDAAREDVRAGTARATKRQKPSSPRGSRARAVGIAEHTDFECFTFLHQDTPGLFLRDRAGAWREAETFGSKIGPRSTFTVIVGDAFERVSNGYFRATPHRVALTPHERFALVRFNGLDPEASIAPFAAVRSDEPEKTKNKKTFETCEEPKYAARATQGEHLARQVTRAARHLENAAKRGAVPGVDAKRLSGETAPVKFAQLLIVAAGNVRGDDGGGDGGDDGSGSRVLARSPSSADSSPKLSTERCASFVLLGLHRTGEFAGLYTGFIAKVKPFETPRDASLRAAKEAGVTFSLESLAEKETFPQRRDVSRTILSGNVSFRERARFRFEGWLADDRVAVEHEFVLRVRDVSDVRFAEDPPFKREPNVRRGKVRDGDSVSVEEREERPHAEETRGNPRVQTKWFARDDVPYASMPADDAVWYPRLFALLDADDAGKRERGKETAAASVSVEPKNERGLTDCDSARSDRSVWTNALAGRFAFDEDGALRDDWEVRVLATDAAM